MNAKNIVMGLVTIGSITLVVSLIVTYLYSLLAHGSGVLDWEMSIRIAIIFGITLPIVQNLDKRKSQ
ncbi:MAG: hypothetical protein AB1428_08855 [Bacteroidota bacterium]